MLNHAWSQGVPTAWVAGDEVYGDAPCLRDGIPGSGKKCVLGVSSTTSIWRERSPVERPAKGPVGRPRENPRLGDGAPPAETVTVVIAALPEGAWKRLGGSEGEEGPRTYRARTLPREARQRQETGAFKELYWLKGRVEGKIAELVHHGLRDTRYPGEKRCQWPRLWTAAVVNVKRLFKLAQMEEAEGGAVLGR